MVTPILKSMLTAAGGAGRRRGLLIFTYHRTLERADPFVADVTGDVFDLHASMLGRFCNVLRLDEAAEMLATNRLPPRAVTITFDDGYADNYSIALPILRKHGLTATFFVSTGYLDGGTMWNDIVINAVRSAADRSLKDYCAQLDGVPGSRVALIRRQIEKLKYETPGYRDEAAREFSRQLGVHDIKPLMMTSDEIRGLAQAGMEIGSHTETHPILKRISVAEAEQEIANSRRTLEGITGNPVTSFAFPNGKPGRDFDREHVDILKDHGFAAAVTTNPGRAGHSDDLLQLPRVGMWQDQRARYFVGLLRHHLHR